MKRRTLLLAIAVASATLVGRAHHSIAGVYDTSRQVTVEGAWRLEVDNRWELAAIGVTAETWKPGDRIVVTGFPGRTQPQSLYVRTLQRPADGFLYEQFGRNPRIRPGRRALLRPVHEAALGRYH